MFSSGKSALGIYFALITALISGFSNYFNKFAVSLVSPPLFFTTLKNLGVGLLLLSILLLSGKWRKIRKLSLRESLYLMLIGVIGGAIPFYLYFTGLTQTSALNAVLIHDTLVFWVAVLAVPLLKEKLSPLQLLAVVLLFGANLSIGGFKGFHFSPGELLILIATVFWAFESILAKKILPQIDSDIVAFYRMGIGSLILFAVSSFSVPSALSGVLFLNIWQLCTVILTMIMLLCYVLSWYRALSLAPAITVAAVLISSSVITNFITVIFESHSLSAPLFVRGILSLTGIVLFLLSLKTNTLKKEAGMLV